MTTIEQQAAVPPYFPVSKRKLVIMSIATFGIYMFYWFYWNWQHQRRARGESIRPGWRAVFSVFYCYSLFKRLRDDQQALAPELHLAAGPLATCWIIANILSSSDYTSLFFPLSVLFLLPAQSAADVVNAAHAPDHAPNDRFGVWNMLAIGIGVFIYALILLGMGSIAFLGLANP